MTDWRHKDLELKRILARNNDTEDELESVKNTKAELIPHLKKTVCYRDLNSIILDRMADAKTFYSFNNALAAIYDYADDNKIWLGFMPTKAEASKPC